MSKHYLKDQTPLKHTRYFKEPNVRSTSQKSPKKTLSGSQPDRFKKEKHRGCRFLWPLCLVGKVTQIIMKTTGECLSAETIEAASPCESEDFIFCF